MSDQGDPVREEAEMTAQPAEVDGASALPETDPRIAQHAQVPAGGRAPRDPVGRADARAVSGLLSMADARLRASLRAEIERGALEGRERRARPVRLGEHEVEDAEDVRVRTEARARAWWSRCPTRFAAARPGDITEDQHGAYLRTWLESPDKPNLILYGKQGTGKTHSAYALGNAAVEAGLWAVAWLMADLNAALRPSAEGDPAAWPAATRCQLLLIDDLGTEAQTDWTHEQLYRLIDHRYREHRWDPERPGLQRRTIVTTNLSGEEFLRRYGPPLVSRMLDGAMHRKFEGEMRRIVAPW